jgi:aryl-alcohol dehydrogenase-like predicted oxidoreductase
MERRPLGCTGLEISALAFGTMSFGAAADEGESARLYAACREAGIDVFDCADVYADGYAEEILGRLAAHERESVVLTTKAGYGRAAEPGGRAGRAHLLRSVEASLRRLGTDRVELLFLHRFDPRTDLEGTLRALEDLVRAGKVVHLGASNFAAWQVATALGISARRGWAGFEAIQPMYSLVKRQAEVELLPLAASEGLGVMPYSPLGGGLLTGKYRAGGAGRLTADARYAARYGPGWMHETAAALAGLAEARGVSPASLAVAWAAAHPAVTAPIIGARTVEQLWPSLAAAKIAMTPELRSEISALAPAPPPATDRLEETN